MGKKIIGLFFMINLVLGCINVPFADSKTLPVKEIESQQIQWSRAYGGINSDDGYFVQPTRDGGYIVGGTTESFGAGETDFYLVKTDPFGNILWSRTYGGSDWDYAYSIQQTRDGGFVVAGYTYSFYEGYDAYVYLIKTDSLGYVQWSRTYGYTTYNYYCYSVQQTTDGGYILAGGRYSYPGGTDVFLLKTDSQGYLDWSRTYGGTSSEYGYSIQQTADGGYIVAGHTNSFGAGYYDVYLIKTDVLGHVQWSRTIGSTDYDRGYSVQQTVDGGYILGGYTYSFTEGYDSDAYLIKTDDLGYIAWSRTYGGTGYDNCAFVEQTTDQGYIFTGGTESFGAMYDEDVYVVKTNSSGNVVWARTYGDTAYEAGRCVRQTADGGYVVVRRATMGELAGEIAVTDDIMLTKLDSFGNTCVGEFVSSTGYAVSSYTDAPGTEEFTPEIQVASPATMTISPPTDTTTICEFILEPEFIIEVRPDTNSLCMGGGSADYYVTLTSVVESDYPCSLFVFGLPPGVTANFYPPVVFPPDTSILLLNASGPISGDTYEFTIFAQWVFYGDTLMDSTQAYLIVSNPPSFVPVVDPVVFFAEESNTLWVEASDPDTTDTLRITPSQGEWDFTQTDSLQGHASGILTWTPSPDDTLDSPYQVVFFVQDNYLCEGIDSSRIFVVYDVNHPPVIWLEPSFSETTIYEGDTLSFYVVVQDPDLDSVFAWMDMIPRPAIFEFYRHLEQENRWEWIVTFTPDYTQAFTYEMTFFASDTAGLADTAQVTIEVLNFNRPPEIEPPFAETTIYERDPLEFSVSGRDPDGDALSCRAYNLPEAAHFDTIECIFSWIPEWGQVAEYYPLFVISDREFADSAVVKITVKNRYLSVKEHYPYSHEEDVLIDSYIHVTLSEPIKFQTVDSSTFVDESRKDGILRGVLIYTENNRLLGFSLPPDSMFSTLDTITVTLTTGIKDLVDSGMAEDYSWEFYTGIGIYPGNTNNDNIVDERDILPLGFYWEKTGPSRGAVHQNLTWSLKPVHRWDPVSAVYADADGNGIVDEWDICGVSDNWDSTVSGSVYKLQESIDFAEEVTPEHLSIYEKIYNALLDCPESEGKNKIRKLLEDILEEKDIPSKFGLSQNYPNPFNLTTVIRYSLLEDCLVEIVLFNVLGQKVRTLVSEYQSAGYRKVIWDGKDNYGQEVGSGIYFYKVNAKDYSCTRKLLFLK